MCKVRKPYRSNLLVLYQEVVDTESAGHFESISTIQPRSDLQDECNGSKYCTPMYTNRAELCPVNCNVIIIWKNRAVSKTRSHGQSNLVHACENASCADMTTPLTCMTQSLCVSSKAKSRGEQHPASLVLKAWRLIIVKELFQCQRSSPYLVSSLNLSHSQRYRHTCIGHTFYTEGLPHLILHTTFPTALTRKSASQPQFASGLHIHSHRHQLKRRTHTLSTLPAHMPAQLDKPRN